MQNSYIFIQENTVENVIAKRQPFCLSLNVLSQVFCEIPSAILKMFNQCKFELFISQQQNLRTLVLCRKS